MLQNKLISATLPKKPADIIQYFFDNIYAHSHLHFSGRDNSLFSKNL